MSTIRSRSLPRRPAMGTRQRPATAGPRARMAQTGARRLLCGAMAAALIDELYDWLRIPSVSTGGGDPEAIERAAAWVLERVRGAGGERDPRRGAGNPL